MKFAPRGKARKEMKIETRNWKLGPPGELRISSFAFRVSRAHALQVFALNRYTTLATNPEPKHDNLCHVLPHRGKAKDGIIGPSVHRVIASLNHSAATKLALLPFALCLVLSLPDWCIRKA
jgi:hypothetical protein